MRNQTLLKQASFAKIGEPFAPVQLPHTWNAFDGQDGGGDYYRGKGTYQIPLPDPTPGKRQYIELQGANHMATVWCNGKKLGSHEGGFSTFRFELTQVMQPCDNMLQVEVDNSVSHIYPQRADFTFFGGLYRDVVFIETEQSHFDLMKDGTQGIFATPYAQGRVRLDIFSVNSEFMSVQVEIMDADGNVVAQEQVEAQPHNSLYVTVPQPRLWQGVADPYCYHVCAALLLDGEVQDQVSIRFGFRSFHVDPKTGFYLNGNSVPLRGVCRHQDRKDKGWALSRQDHEEDMVLIRQVGANTIRLAHYQHDQKFYDLCDDAGMVVWAEIPYISQHLPGKEACDNTISQMRELIAQNYNHPSICFWGIGNELTIGGFSEELYRNLSDLNALCKKMDPSRLTTLANLGTVPAGSEHNRITDVVSYNYYLGWYTDTVEDNGPRFDDFHAANPDLAYGISEYGADHMPHWHSAEPFNHDYTEEYAVFYHQEMLKTFAPRPYLWATHVWNMFDFAADARNEGGVRGLNCKGLVTFDRQIKKDSFYVYRAWWSKEPMVHICSKRFVRRSPKERNITVFTNEAEVSLYVNGVFVQTQTPVDHKVVFANVSMTEGENRITVKTAKAEDQAVFEAVDNHDETYDLPEVIEALTAGNWFAENDDNAPEVKNGFSLEVPVGELLGNETCYRIIRGWIMGNHRLKPEDRLAIVSRLVNWQAMWGDRYFDRLATIKKHMTAEELQALDKMLKRIKR